MHGLPGLRCRLPGGEQPAHHTKEYFQQRRAYEWIRIERYWEGEFPNVKARYIPIMCQHCENAPCEPVCPVYATYHNDEGLNVQVYNRCVGTRYCANNCPYQVRFFNWWEPQWPERLRNQLNPDVTHPLPRHHGALLLLRPAHPARRDNRSSAGASSRPPASASRRKTAT